MNQPSSFAHFKFFPYLVYAFTLTLLSGLLLKAEEGEKRLTVELISRKDTLVERGISRLAWHPDSQQISYFRQKGSGQEAKTSLWSYDVQGGKESKLIDLSDEEEKLSLSSYQWSL